MKKIAVISTSYPPSIWNSQGRSAFSIAYGLKALGHDVTIYTYTSRLGYFRKRDLGIDIHYVGVNNLNTLSIADIGRWTEHIHTQMLREDYHTIILTDAKAWNAAKLYKATKDCVVIGVVDLLYSFIGWLQPVSTDVEENMLSRESDFLMHCDKLVCSNMRFAQKLATYTDKNVFVIPNSYLPIGQILEKPAKVKNSICYIGKVNIERNIERIIRVLPNLPEATLTVASPEISEGYKGVLHRLAKTLDVENRISYIGWLSAKETKELYLRSEVACVPSNFEPYGYGAIDPIALGVPVVVSEWSNLKEYLADNTCVFVSLDELEDRFKTLFSSEEYRQEVARRNLEKLHSSYTQEICAAHMEQLL